MYFQFHIPKTFIQLNLGYQCWSIKGKSKNYYLFTLDFLWYPLKGKDCKRKIIGL